MNILFRPNWRNEILSERLDDVLVTFLKSSELKEQQKKRKYQLKSEAETGTIEILHSFFDVSQVKKQEAVSFFATVCALILVVGAALYYITLPFANDPPSSHLCPELGLQASNIDIHHNFPRNMNTTRYFLETIQEEDLSEEQAGTRLQQFYEQSPEILQE